PVTNRDERPRQDDGDESDVPEVVDKLEHRRHRYARRSLPFRIAWTAAGFILTIAGIVMMVTPGPAMVLIPAGLVMLSFEFKWAERLLDYGLKRGVEAKHYVDNMDPRKRRAATIAGTALALIAIGAIVWYWFFVHQ
ncbi:MAG TPA: PGPGW domain-containing protein, partial [Gammaproteobacteria bacterium]|nr:PGPGW domain-containing protein [Gammaproteobacteria bacterium]